ESEHRVLGNTLTRVPTQYPPCRASVDGNLLEDSVAGSTPPGRVRGVGQFSRAPRHKDRRGPTLKHGFIARPCVVSPIARHLIDRIGNLLQQPGQGLAIMHPTPGELYRNDLFRTLINSQVQLAPRAPTT